MSPINRFDPAMHPYARRSSLEGRWHVLDKANRIWTDITYISVSPAPRSDVERGLVSYVQLEFEELLVVDSIAVRRDSQGNFSLSFPKRTALSGTKYPIVRPCDEQGHEAIQEAVFEILRGGRRAIRHSSLADERCCTAHVLRDLCPSLCPPIVD